MKAVQLTDATELDRLVVASQPEPGAPPAGEIRVRVHANSLNYHDYLAVIRGADNIGRVPLADGAGVVEALGEGVTEFTAGDRVVSTFWPTRLNGGPELPTMDSVPGDGTDGFAQGVVVRPAMSFTKAPTGWIHEEAATLPIAGLTA